METLLRLLKSLEKLSYIVATYSFVKITGLVSQTTIVMHDLRILLGYTCKKIKKKIISKQTNSSIFDPLKTLK